jgi:alpha-tubulin suppressor-like RCC1 family protein
VWGQNAEGQLGLGDFSQRNRPTLVDFLVGTNVVHIATGAYHTIILTGEGLKACVYWCMSIIGHLDVHVYVCVHTHTYIRACVCVFMCKTVMQVAMGVYHALILTGNVPKCKTKTYTSTYACRLVLCGL